MIVSILAAALLLADGTPAAADAADKKAKVADADPMVCKNEAVLGSRMPKRVCQLKSEWERQKAEARANLDRSQTQRGLSHNGQ
ncbi:hypothetical protein [Phenylobacterium zucineum]|uniref:hypothetical protein n=1 Tax=Phenylobacterium zucineum TaxID=284016 RepID=UPI00030B34A3|nr:hypothetical protein [Phenylobacterium zucineum]